MSELSKYFKRSEFACKCFCGFDAVDTELLRVLEDVREHFNAPVTINSGNRCKMHNASIGGAEKSNHVNGIAADIRVEGVEPDAVAYYLNTKYFDKYGLGIYSSWTHIDVRQDKARWLN